MRIQGRLWCSLIVLAWCMAPPCPLLAQNKEADSPSLPEIIKSIQPSTVLVVTYDDKGEVSKTGSGFFVTPSGNIITNRHVLEGASRAEIKTAQGKVCPITQIVAEDREGDLIQAAVDIPADLVQPVKLSSTIPQVGERVVVVGNPLGLEGTASEGIVSAVRDIPAFGRIIQLSAPISPGSSGSPVVDMKGRVIGVATFQTTEGQNLNFAMPCERLKDIKQGQPKALAEWRKESPDAKLTSAEDSYNTGLTYLWSENYQQALPFFERAVKENPDYADAWLCVGYCQDELGRYAEGVKAYKQAIRIKPDFANAHYNLGVAYRQLGRHSEAIEAYKQAIRITPDYAGAHYNLGIAYGKLGRYAEAIEAFKQAIRLQPDLATAHYNLGITYLIVGDRGSALEEYRSLKDLDKDLANRLFNLIYE